MKYFSVFEPEHADGDVYRRSEKLVFVSSGFSWLAFLAPVIWAIVNRTWLVLVGFALLAIGVEILVRALELHAIGALLIGLLLNFAFAVEAGTLLRWTLKRKGYREVGLATGATRDACELQFLKTWGETVLSGKNGVRVAAEG